MNLGTKPTALLVALASLVAVSLGCGQVGDLGSEERQEDPAVEQPESVHTFDVRRWFNSNPTGLDARRAAHDDLVALATLQGLANRTGANFYIFFAPVRWTTTVNADELWLDRLRTEPAVGRQLLDGRQEVALPDFEAVLDEYLPLVNGLVVWDENVPATLNAAFAVAGADDLLPVRWDSSPTSLFSRLRARGLPLSVLLVGQDGAPLFKDGQGTALIPGTTRRTTGTAKDDVYVWVTERYLKQRRLDPTEFAYVLDGAWIGHPLRPSLGLGGIATRDLIVAARGLSYDLSPWSDVAATDAPSQVPGLDVEILREMLSVARAQADARRIISITGFVPWQYKYTTTVGLPEGYGPVKSEWTSAQVISPFAAGLDADPNFSNASFYRHVSMSETPAPQPRPTAEDLIGHGFLSGLAPNGGFEDGSSGWTLRTTHRSILTDDASTGPRARSGLRFLRCNTTGDPEHTIFRDAPGVQPGREITLRAFVRAPGAPVQGSLVVFAIGGGTEYGRQTFTATKEWTEVRARLTVRQAGHSKTRGQLYLATTGANLDVDDVAFYEGDPASARVEPANYVLWYVGDYDASSWMHRYSPDTWDTPGRGIIPFAWGFGGSAGRHFPPFFNYVLATRTPRDFFVSANSGPAYGNPGVMGAAARDVWRQAGVDAARHLDTAAGWLLDGLDVVDSAHMQAVTPFFGDGVLLLAKGGSVPSGSIVDHAPVVALSTFRGKDSVLSKAPPSPSLPAFTAFRTTQGSYLSTNGTPKANNVELVTLSNDLVVNHAAGKYRFVDPFTFFYLARKQFGGSNSYRASYPSVVVEPPVPGRGPIVRVTVRNDGWDTWRAGGSNPYRIGFDISDRPQRVRELPAQPGAYPIRASLPTDVPPGAEATVTVTLPWPPGARMRTVQIDVVREGITWFETQGDIPLQLTLRSEQP